MVVITTEYGTLPNEWLLWPAVDVETGGMGAATKQAITCSAVRGRLQVGGHLIHSIQLLERLSPHIDANNRQRLWEPLDVPADLEVTGVEQRRHVVLVDFSDGERVEFELTSILQLVGADRPAHADIPRPAPRSWTSCGTEVPLVDYRELCDPSTSDEALIAALSTFFELGFFVLTNTPAAVGALREITRPFGRISATNFGELFDVRTEPRPVDLAYTPVALSAHTDQPYRAPVPGLQFLHVILNDAPGGASTMVDGLAAADALAEADPEAHAVLTTLPIEFRYDIGSDMKRADGPIIERAADGTFRQMRFSPRLDFAPYADADILDVYYRGRRWLAAALNDPTRQLNYRMRSGDVAVVDNHRVLHGRTAFDPTRGARHLQGCYIDHDGPLTAWTLAWRRLNERK